MEVVPRRQPVREYTLSPEEERELDRMAGGFQEKGGAGTEKVYLCRKNIYLFENK